MTGLKDTKTIKKKKKVYFYILATVLILLTIIFATKVNSTMCLQQNANETSSCGHSGTGTYYYPNTNFWDIGGITEDGRVTDNNFTTGNRADTAGDTALIYINYSNVSVQQSSPILEALIGGLGLDNYTVNSSCLLNPIQIRLYSFWSITWQSSISCYNTTNWVTMISSSGANGAYGMLYDEQMWWNVSCVNASENLNVNESMTLCPGVYQLNDSDANGALIINASNIVLDCNGATITGNNATNSYGIKVSTTSVKNNITIIHCNISNFYFGLFTDSNSNNVTIKNNIFAGNGQQGWYTWAARDSVFKDNILYNSSIYITGLRDTNITNNSVFCGNTKYCGINSGATLRSDKMINVIVENNIFDGAEKGLYLYKQNWNATIRNNLISNHDRGIHLYYVNNTPNDWTYIYNNTLLNNTNNFDTYTLGMEIQNSTYIKFYNNSFINQTDVGIIIQSSYNISIWNNSFDLVCINGRNNFAGGPQNEPCAAISLGERFKTWCYSDGCNEDISKSASSDISIWNNTFDADTNVFVWGQGMTNISITQLPSYWYRAIQFNNSGPSGTSYGKTEYYINNLWDNLSNRERGYNISSTGGDHFYWGANNTGASYMMFGINKTNIYLFYRSGGAPFNVTVINISAPQDELFDYKNQVYNAASIGNTYQINLTTALDKYEVRDGGCDTIPTEDLNVNQSMTTCPGTYQFNDTNVNGVFRINASNIVFQGNNTVIIGNYTTGNKGINGYESCCAYRNNVTIKGFNISGFVRNIEFVTGENNSILNNNIGNASQYAVIVGAATTAKYFTIANNYFSNITASPIIYMNGEKGYSIYNNTFIGTKANNFFYAIQDNLCMNKTNIYNNTFVNISGISLAYSTLNSSIYANYITTTNLDSDNYRLVNIQNSSDTNISGNIIVNAKAQIFFKNINNNLYIFNNSILNDKSVGITGQSTTGWISIYGNYIDNLDIGIRMQNVSDVLIENNTVLNTSDGNWGDDYDVGIFLDHLSNNIIINNNTISNYGTTGILVKTSNAINITNNTISPMSFTDRLYFGGKDVNEPTTGIFLAELYKSYVDGLTWGYNETAYTLPYIQNVSKHSSYNVRVLDNKFSGNQVQLRMQGAYNVTNNLVNYYYLKIDYPAEIQNATEYYIDNAYTNVSNYRNCTTKISNVLAYNFLEGGCGTHDMDNFLWEYTITNWSKNFYNNATIPTNFSITGLVFPFGDVLNVTPNSLLATNVTSFSINLSAGQQISISDFMNLSSFTAPSSVLLTDNLVMSIDTGSSLVNATGCTFELYDLEWSPTRRNVTSNGVSSGVVSFTSFAGDYGITTLVVSKVWCNDGSAYTVSNTSINQVVYVLSSMTTGTGGSGGGGGSSPTIYPDTFALYNLTDRPSFDSYFVTFGNSQEWVTVLDVNTKYDYCDVPDFQCTANSDGTITIKRYMNDTDYLFRTYNSTGVLVLGSSSVRFPVNLRAINLGYSVPPVYIPAYYFILLIIAVAAFYAFKK